MEPQAIDLLGMGNILDFALGAGLGQHMDDLEGILAVRTVRIRQNNVYAFIREVAFVYRNPLAAVIVFKRDVVKRHAILPAGQFRCQLCLNLFDRIQFRNIFEFLRNGQTADDYLMRFYAHIRHFRYVLDRDGVTAVCVLLGFHCVTAVQRCISSRFVVDAVVAVDDQLADYRVVACQTDCKCQLAVLTDFARRLRIIRYALYVGDLPAGAVGRDSEACVVHKLDGYIGLAGQARDNQLVRDVILIYTVYRPLCDQLLVSSVFYGRRCREYDLAAAGNTCRTVLLRRNGLAVCRCSNRCAGICTLNIQGYIVVDRAVKYGLDCGISANFRQCQRIAGCSLCSTAVNRPFLEIVAIAARHCRNSRAAAALDACRFCRRRTAALTCYRNSVCRALNQRCGNLSLCGYILHGVTERYIRRIGHLSDCRAVHLPCLHHIVCILRRYGEGYVRTGGNIAVRDRLAVCGDGDTAVSAVPHSADRNHCLEGDCNRAVFGYVQGVGAAAVDNRMTVYRPLVNLITLIGFCGEGNLSAAVDLCAICNRCTQRAVCRLAVRYFVLSCTELCFNMICRYVRLRETAVLDRPRQRIAAALYSLAVYRPAGHGLTCRWICGKGELLAAACGRFAAVCGDVIACGDVILNLPELRCNVNRVRTGRIRIDIGFRIACFLVTHIVNVPAFDFVTRLYLCRELD